MLKLFRAPPPACDESWLGSFTLVRKGGADSPAAPLGARTSLAVLPTGSPAIEGHLATLMRAVLGMLLPIDAVSVEVRCPDLRRVLMPV